jgi:hypothetical protein
MAYTFKIDQIEILNQLIFDASIDFEEIQNLLLLENMELETSVKLELERRAFENVTRKSSLFLTTTELNGKISSISFEHISKLTISGLNDQFHCNHFINGLTFDQNQNLNLTTAFGLSIDLYSTENTLIHLTDLQDSDFGKGTFLKKTIGFTTEEWETYLKDKNYLP